MPETPTSPSGLPPPGHRVRPDWSARLRWLAAGSVLLLAFCLSLSEIGTTDFFWHLESGDWILKEKAVPRTDPFSYTSADRPWVDLHWGFQAVVASIHRQFGLDGLIVGRSLVVTATAALLLFGFSWRPNSLAAVAAVLLAMLASHERFMMRPEIVSFLLLASVLSLVEKRFAGGGWRVAILAGLSLFWVNFHSLFVLGLVVIGLAFFGDLIDSGRNRFGRLPIPEAVRGRRDHLWGIAAVALATLAALVNPYGYRAFTLPLLQLRERIAPGSLYAETIAEFQLPFDPGVGTAALLAGWILWVVGASLILFRPRRVPTRHILFFLVFSWLAFRARRNLPVFAIAAVPGVVTALRDLGRSGAGSRFRIGLRRAGPGILAVAALILAGLVCTNRFYLWERMDRSFGAGVRPAVAPAGAVGFIQENRIPGRVFHDLYSAGFFLWRTYPDRQVFFDGRLEVYPEELYRTFLTAQVDPKTFEAIAAQYGIDLVLWTHAQSGNARPLLAHLQRVDTWRLVYLDATASVFQRSGQGARPTLDPESLLPAEILGAGLPPTTWLQGLVERLIPFRVAPPVTAVQVGLALANLGAWRSAERFLLVAEENPAATPEVFFNLGVLYDTMGLTEKAVLKYEKARLANRFRTDPLGWWFRYDFRRTVMMRLGEGFFRMDLPDRGREILAAAGKPGRARLLAMEAYRLQQEGDPAGAVERYRESLEEEPGRPEVLHNLGLALLEAGRIQEAQSVLEETVVANPEDAEASYNLGNIHFSAGRYPEAVMAFETAVLYSPEFASAQFNLGVARIQEGSLPGAIAALQEAVRLEPANPQFQYQLGFALARAGNLQEAIGAYSQAILNKDDFVEAFFNLGEVFRRLGRHPEALESYRRCLQLGMSHPRLYLQISRVHAIQGETEEALEWLRRVPLPRAADRRNLTEQMPELEPILELLESSD